MNKVKSVLFVAGVLLALVFTLSCSGGGGGDGNESCSVVQSDAPSLGGIFENPEDAPWWFSPEAIKDIKKGGANELFKPGNVVELLPVPKHITYLDTIKAYYPGSVGILFDIADRLGQNLKKFVQDKCLTEDYKSKCKVNGKDLTESNIDELAPGAISINASAFYHTNAYRNTFSVKCTDQIFKNWSGTGDCILNAYNYYLAWDLKDNCGKFVKAGTYKSTGNFYVTIEYIDASGNHKSETLVQDKYTTMLEVRYK